MCLAWVPEQPPSLPAKVTTDLWTKEFLVSAGKLFPLLCKFWWREGHFVCNCLLEFYGINTCVWNDNDEMCTTLLCFFPARLWPVFFFWSCSKSLRHVAPSPPPAAIKVLGWPVLSMRSNARRNPKKNHQKIGSTSLTILWLIPFKQQANVISMLGYSSSTCCISPAIALQRPTAGCACLPKCF